MTEDNNNNGTGDTGSEPPKKNATRIDFTTKYAESGVEIERKTVIVKDVEKKPK